MKFYLAAEIFGGGFRIRHAAVCAAIIIHLYIHAANGGRRKSMI